MVRNPDSDHAVTTDTEAEITHFKTQIQAYQARISFLQQQQLVTLDALDQLQRQQRDDLEEELKARRKIQERLWMLKRKVKEVEVEKDDLRDAVLELVHEVEARQKNLASWLPSRLHLSSCLAPPEQRHPFGTTNVPKDLDSQQLSYAGSIIRALTHDLHLERQAHAATQARVHLLEAQVASRDAQIDAWIQHPEAWILGPISPISSRSRSRSRKRRERLTIERAKSLEGREISTVLDQSLQNNRILELEVRNLEMTLEQARLNAGANSIVPFLSSLQSSSSPVPSRGRSKSTRRNAPQTPPRTLHSDLPNTAHIPSLHAPLPPRLSSLTHAPSPGPSKVSRKRRPSIHSSPERPPTPRQGPSSAAWLLQSLERQIHALSAQIDAFKDERETLRRVIMERRGRSGDEDEEIEDAHAKSGEAHGIDATSVGEGPPFVGTGVETVERPPFADRSEYKREWELHSLRIDRSVQTSEPEPELDRRRRLHRRRHDLRLPNDQHDHPHMGPVEHAPPIEEYERATPQRGVYRDLEGQIHALAIQIDAFQDERESLWHVVAREREGGRGRVSRVLDGGADEGRFGDDIDGTGANDLETGGGNEPGRGVAHEEHIVVTHEEPANDTQAPADGFSGENNPEKYVSEDGEQSMDLETPPFPPVLVLPTVTDPNSNRNPIPSPDLQVLPPLPPEVNPQHHSPSPSRSRSSSRRHLVHSPHPRARHRLPRRNHGHGAMSDPGPRLLGSEEEGDGLDEEEGVEGDPQIRMIPPRIPSLSRSRSPSPTWP